MNKKIAFIFIIIGVVVLAAAFIFNLKNDFTVTSKINSNILIELNAKPFTNERTSEVFIKVGKIEGLAPWAFEAKDVQIELFFSDGIELIGNDFICLNNAATIESLNKCKIWTGDIIGDEVVELKGKIKAANDGDYIFNVGAGYPIGNGREGNAVGFYIRAERGDIKISENGFEQSNYLGTLSSWTYYN